MNILKNVSASIMILIGFLCILNAIKCFMTIDMGIRIFIIKFGLTGMLMVIFGIVLKECIDL